MEHSDGKTSAQRAPWLIVLLLAAAFGIGAGLYASSQEDDVSTAFTHGDRTYFPLPEAPPPQFTLVNQYGETVTEQSFDGKLRLVFFGYTSCPDVCPTTLARLTRALEALGPDAKAVAPIFITVDPERDTPERLKTYAAAFDPRIIALSGSAEAIDATAEAFNAFYSRIETEAGHYLMNHPGLVYLYDREGRPVAALNDHASPEDIVRAVRARL